MKIKAGHPKMWARFWDSDVRSNVVGEIIGYDPRDSWGMINTYIQLDSGKIVRLYHPEYKAMTTEEKDKYLLYKARREARKAEKDNT